jgi:hypothetical protein
MGVGIRVICMRLELTINWVMHAEGLVHDSMEENFNFSQYLFAIFTDQMSFSIFKLCVV